MKFLENYVHLKMDAAQYLVDAGVKTPGFDYLRVSKLEADNEVYEMLINNLNLFAGLNLAGVLKENIRSLVYPFL